MACAGHIEELATSERLDVGGGGSSKAGRNGRVSVCIVIGALTRWKTPAIRARRHRRGNNRISGNWKQC